MGRFSISDGKFLDGAVTGAFSRLFNDEFSKPTKQDTSVSCSAEALSCRALTATKTYESLNDRGTFLRRSPIINSRYSCTNSCTATVDTIDTRYQVGSFWFEDKSTLAMEGVNMTETDRWVSSQAEWKTDINIDVRNCNPSTSRHPELRNWAQEQLQQ